MKNTIKILAFAILTVITGSCNKVKPDGPVITEIRAHSGFRGLSTSIPSTTVFKQSADYLVEIHAQKDLLDRITSVVSGSELQIYYSGSYSFGSHEPITVYISGPDVTDFTLNGSGSLRCDSLKGSTDPVRFKTTGSGAMEISTVNASSISTETTGSGSIRVVRGVASRVSCKASGSGGIDVGGVQATDVDAQTMGSGSIHVWATTSLDARTSGSGSIYYRGTPRLTSSSSGSGRVQPY